jgi:polysaccharide chain length determinant protein (PEP-CTERM system associated)
MHALQVLLRKQLSAAWRYRWIAVLFSWLVCGVGWAITFTIPNIFEASARLYVDADVVLTPLLRGIAVDSTSAAQLDMLQRTLLSRPNLEKLISKTDLELDLQGASDRETLVAQLANDIRITPQTRNLFTIAYRSTSPKLAFDVVRTMLTTFVESKTGNNRNDLENAGKFLQAQIALYERQLQEAERKRAEFRVKYIDILPAGDGGASRLEAQQGNVRALQGQLLDAIARRASFARELATTPQLIVTETDAGGPGSLGGTSRLREAERLLQELRLRYTEQHPDVVAQRDLVAAMRSGAVGSSEPGAPRSSARSRSVSNPIFEQMKVRNVENDSVIASLQRQTADATRERDRLEEIARGAPQLQADFANVNRDYEVLRKNYDDLLARRESMRISSAAEADGDKVKIQVIDPPQVPQNPVAPKRVLLMSGVLVAGLAAGVGLALLLVQMDQSFHTVEDLRDMGFPVVGGVSLIRQAVPLGRRVLTIGAFAIAASAPMIFYSGLLLRLLRTGVVV